jgi:amino acid transporter
MGDIPKIENVDVTATKMESKTSGFMRIVARMCHSFLPRVGEHGPQALAETEGQAGDITRLKRKLRSRHIQMISIGGCIGCGLFIGSGACLKEGGPGAILVAFSIIGIMIFCMVNAMAELATLFPIQGAPFHN